MNTVKTQQALAAITDEGLFERLATAILRENNPIYHSLVHSGVNIEGKTVKSLLDGICFVKGADPPHMIAVHHTITARNNLENKWLHDPSTVKPRKGSRPTAPYGDLIKTAKVVAEERTHIPNLRATLVLTTNKEPGEVLVRAVEATGRDLGLEIDLWSRSRLSHFLDNHPSGQWIRHSLLNIEQELLSPELLYELSKLSLENHLPLDNPAAWIPRSLDTTLTTSLRRDVTFLLAESGFGKSVACYRELAEHIKRGKFGIVVSHQVISATITLEQAVMKTLQQLHPSLASEGISALSICSPERPLLIVVEDINRSGQTRLLVEKIASWSSVPTKDRKVTPSTWRLLCPLWPEVLSSLSDQSRKRIEPLIVTASGFSKREGRDAVLARARLDGLDVSSLSAEETARTLGYDPLLIALHNHHTVPDPHYVIGNFVESSLFRTAAMLKEHPASDYREALRTLAEEMITNRQIELSWRQINGWAKMQGQPLRLLGHLAHQRELIRITGPSENQRLSFRHDRVREWILADAVTALDHRNHLTEEVLAEPFFAETLGEVIVWGKPKLSFLRHVAAANPLALFHALLLLGQASCPRYQDILQKIGKWIDDPATHDRSNLHLRLEALAKLAETDSPAVPAIVHRFRDQTINGQLARLRNGDLSGGIELCTHIEPGVGAPWRDIHIEHAKLHHGQKLTTALDGFLRQKDLGNNNKIGALRLAGHIADTRLGLAIEECWTADHGRNNHLDGYLWALAHCCADDPERFLGPVCDAWAALPDQSDKKGLVSPRDELAAHELRWAFHKWPPLAAIDYFIQRGSKDDLRWPITYMLHGMDHPKAVVFVVQELAAIRRRLEGTISFSPFLMSAKRDWRHAQEDFGRPMSKASRDLLLGLWQDEKNDKHLRTQAFSLWAATHYSGDIEVLRDAKDSVELADKVLEERLIRGDQLAISSMIKKLSASDRGYWWQFGRHIWSSELTEVLDDFLTRRGNCAKRIWDETFNADWITCEMTMRLQESHAERLLLKHWNHLRFCPYFVQTALYVSTPKLLESAKTAISECPNPAKLLVHLSQHFGIRSTAHPGLTREAQVLALKPYLHLLSPIDIFDLWNECNVRGWFAVRRKLLDERLQPPYLQYLWNSDHATSALDNMADENHRGMIDIWIDKFLKSGVPWSEILSTMMAWLDQRRSLKALRVVAAAIQHQGTRKDLALLQTCEGMTETAARQLIVDTEFAIRRRSIR